MGIRYRKNTPRVRIFKRLVPTSAFQRHIIEAQPIAEDGRKNRHKFIPTASKDHGSTEKQRAFLSLKSAKLTTTCGEVARLVVLKKPKLPTMNQYLPRTRLNKAGEKTWRFDV